MATGVDEAVLFEKEAAFFLFGAPEKVDFFEEETTFPSAAAVLFPGNGAKNLFARKHTRI